MRKALFILSLLDDGDIEWLAVTGRKEQAGAGSVLIREGQVAKMLYILLEGRLSVFVEEDPEREINSLLPGEVIGELSFLDSRPPAASVAAVSNSTLLAVPRDKLQAKLDRDLPFAARFYRALGVFIAHRLRQSLVLYSGAGRGAPLTGEEELADEIDGELLESVSLGGRRFQYLLERVGT